mmetsp:Transcript_15254/g.57985  ORF Transcript_15254/g.57985 Transcript_15254/m.57985 type:complete len:81 (+) Transcript_15254:66-308(+)
MNRGGAVAWGAALALFGAWQYYDYSTSTGDNFSGEAQERWNKRRQMMLEVKRAAGFDSEAEVAEKAKQQRGKGGEASKAA